MLQNTQQRTHLLQQMETRVNEVALTMGVAPIPKPVVGTVNYTLLQQMLQQLAGIEESRAKLWDQLVSYMGMLRAPIIELGKPFEEARGKVQAVSTEIEEVEKQVGCSLMW